MKPQWKEKDRIDTVLDDIVIAPDRYAAVADPDRYADPNSYAGADRYAAADRYRGVPLTEAGRLELGRYLKDRYGKAKPGRTLIRRIILVVPPPPRTEGRLLWLPSSEYERCFDYYETCLWELGNVVDFDDAAESAQWQGYGDEDDDCRLYAVGAASERDTFVADDWWQDGSSIWQDVYRPEKQFYPLRGAYAVSRIGYTSDLTGMVVGGWRSVYLEPVPGPWSANA